MASIIEVTLTLTLTVTVTLTLTRTRYRQEFLDIFAVTDMDSTNHTSHPLLNLTQPREFVLEAGEMVIIPFGWPHQVENLEPTVAIAGNFVDFRNYEAPNEG